MKCPWLCHGRVVLNDTCRFAIIVMHAFACMESTPCHAKRSPHPPFQQSVTPTEILPGCFLQCDVAHTYRLHTGITLRLSVSLPYAEQLSPPFPSQLGPTCKHPYPPPPPTEVPSRQKVAAHGLLDQLCPQLLSGCCPCMLEMPSPFEVLCPS